MCTAWLMHSQDTLQFIHHLQNLKTEYMSWPLHELYKHLPAFFPPRDTLDRDYVMDLCNSYWILDPETNGSELCFLFERHRNSKKTSNCPVAEMWIWITSEMQRKFHEYKMYEVLCAETQAKSWGQTQPQVIESELAALDGFILPCHRLTCVMFRHRKSVWDYLCKFCSEEQNFALVICHVEVVKPLYCKISYTGLACFQVLLCCLSCCGSLQCCECLGARQQLCLAECRWQFVCGNSTWLCLESD